MVTRVQLCLGTAIAAAFLSATAAGAATVDLGYERFGRGDLSAARDAMSGFLGSHTVKNLHLETFEGYNAWNGHAGTTNPQTTKVGSFTSFGAAGSGALGGRQRLQAAGARRQRA